MTEEKAEDYQKRCITRLFPRSPIPNPPGILGGWGVNAKGKASDCDNIGHADNVIRDEPKKLKLWLKEANKRLATGDARMALVLGRSMHWNAADEHAQDAEKLLIAAYEALGRNALAGITRAHYKDRPQGDVNCLEDDPDDTRA